MTIAKRKRKLGEWRTPQEGAVNGGVLLALVAILVLGMMVYVASAVGLDLSDILCWLEVACKV